jgi:hypothetical protein
MVHQNEIALEVINSYLDLNNVITTVMQKITDDIVIIQNIPVSGTGFHCVQSK